MLPQGLTPRPTAARHSPDVYALPGGSLAAGSGLLEQRIDTTLRVVSILMG